MFTLCIQYMIKLRHFKMRAALVTIVITYMRTFIYLYFLYVNKLVRHFSTIWL